MSEQGFIFEREDADGRVREVEFTDEGDQRIAAFVADFFGGMGITGVRWVNGDAEVGGDNDAVAS